MPWLYIEPGKGFPADITDDDANVIGVLTHYNMQTRQDMPGVYESQVILDIFVTDFDGWMKSFHEEFMGKGRLDKSS